MTELQTKLLDMVKEIVKICEKHDIPYFAIGGTCLGAIRHDGFIPWDDDIDIAVPIEEYDRFKKALEAELPEYMEMYNGHTVKHTPLVIPKINDSRTTFVEETIAKFPDAYHGLFVDVMEMSGVPEGGLERKIFDIKLSAYMFLNSIIRFPSWREETAFRKAVSILVTPLKLILPYDYFFTKWEKLIAKYPMKDSDTVCYVWSKNFKKRMFRGEWFKDYEYKTFEDMQIRCPKGWDGFLTTMYGDYMELPPEEGRVAHGEKLRKMSLTRSYKYYQDKAAKLREKAK